MAKERKVEQNFYDRINSLTGNLEDNQIVFTNKSEINSMSKKREIKIDQSQAKIGIGYSEKVEAEKIAGNINEIDSKILKETVAKVQYLLEEVSKTYPTETLTQQAVVAEQVIQEINNDFTLKQRVVSAIKAMGVEAFMEGIDHPVANILRAGMDGFKKPNN